MGDIKLDGQYNMKKYFENINDRQKTLEYLGEKSDIFWNYLNLVVYTQRILEKCDNMRYPKFAMNMLFCDFLNHIVTTYDLLLQNMQRECFIILRQSYEVFWLLKYFDKKPMKEKDWIKAPYQKEIDKIVPRDVRKAFPEEKKNMGLQYGNMSDYVHSNFNSYDSISLGGFYDEKFIDFGMMKLIVTLYDMQVFLYSIFMKKPASYLHSDSNKIYIINKNTSIDNNVKEELCNSLKVYRELIRELPKFLITRDYDEEALEYLLTQGYLKS